MPSTPHAQTAFGLERLVFFTDAVFAIAITLLAIEIRIPEGTPDADLQAALAALIRPFAAFVLSFAVIGVYWLAHHRMFRYIVRWSPGLLAWNLVLLFFVVLQPVVTAILGRYGNLALPVILYAATLAGTGLGSTGLWLFAGRAGLVSQSVSPAQSQFLAARAAVVPAVFLASIPIAILDPQLAIFSWAVIVPLLWLVRRRMGVGMPLVDGQQA